MPATWMATSSRTTLALVALALLVSLPGCRKATAPGRGETRPSSASTGSPAPRPRLVALGDSLTAGYGLQADQSYPSLLEQRLRRAGLEIEVVNAGVSGDTSAGGLRRLDWALDGEVRVLIVALGGNDALRGLPTDELERNLASIIERAQARHIRVILAGMEAPPNLGPLYAAGFRKVYRELADRYEVPCLPFLLDGVAGDMALNQSDGIHPNADGTVRVTDNLWPYVEKAVRDAIAP
jgi:acyl-CoA thioesterase I